jgi:hypothetical protein
MTEGKRTHFEYEVGHIHSRQYNEELHTQIEELETHVGKQI